MAGVPRRVYTWMAVDEAGLYVIGRQSPDRMTDKHVIGLLPERGAFYVSYSIPITITIDTMDFSSKYIV